MAKIKIGILSDTHGWLDPELVDIFQDKQVDLLIHAGDIGNQEVIDQLEAIAELKIVKGNIDGGDLRFLPETLVFTVGPRKFVLRHIAGSPRSPNMAARGLIAEHKPDIFICGHSHIPVVGRVKETLWVNPGACGRVGFHDLCFALFLYVDEESGELEMERIHLGSRVAGFKKP